MKYFISNILALFGKKFQFSKNKFQIINLNSLIFNTPKTEVNKKVFFIMHRPKGLIFGFLLLVITCRSG